MSDRLLNVNVVAADRQVWSGAAQMVVAKTSEGEVGLLSGHEPMLAILVPGEIRVTVPEGKPLIARTSDGGFISVEHDTVTIVVRDAQLIA